ncbi:hypothetical protein CAC42_5622 [Sphaceloma murrayae]|uniref:SGNH hydrolase-type esterase domain-containing protein n=1 Tax=Sphaceloma murrayae TaxID=2082308 RepID=A0A2K1QYP1_9PEZI|nr:hypothetical protein CAC42_5622 [Sphaceloma murrayae]
MRSWLALSSLLVVASAAILQNGQLRENPYPGQATFVTTALDSTTWKTYQPNATEISYKGRWDSKHVSWWSAPGLKFGFTGSNVALSFGQYTSEGVLVAYRIGGLDWQFSNVTANATYQFIDSSTPGVNLTAPGEVLAFELRVTNWAYGVQLAGVHIDTDASLTKLPDFGRRLEIIGDSLTAGQYQTYEGVSSWAWGLSEGLGQTEFSTTAYPGICLTDKNCWGNPHGQTYQWFKASDTSYRASQIWGDDPEDWDFASHPAADLTLINIGTNDNNTANNVTQAEFYNSYLELIDGIHKVWPTTQIVIMTLQFYFYQSGTTYKQSRGFVDEILAVDEHYRGAGFVHLFDTSGILAHNDVGPQYHPTDVGALKIATHLMRYVNMKFGWELLAEGPMVQSGTLYWNDQSGY